MNTDCRALCAELIEAVLADDSRLDILDIARRARAALAAEPVGEGPTDEEIMELMPSQMHADLAAAVRAMAEQEGIDNTPAKGALRIIFNWHCVDLARAVLARWGHQPAPVPVAERPWKREGWCDPNDKCWCFNSAQQRWEFDYCTVAASWAEWMLPYSALPLPACIESGDSNE